MSSPQPGIKDTCRTHPEIRLIAVFRLFFNRLMKDLFWIVLCSSYDMIITFGENRIDQARLCDMQISYKMVSNAHVRQLTVSLIN